MSLKHQVTKRHPAVEIDASKIPALRALIEALFPGIQVANTGLVVIAKTQVQDGESQRTAVMCRAEEKVWLTEQQLKDALVAGERPVIEAVQDVEE
jgi:hypothetical protein